MLGRTAKMVIGLSVVAVTPAAAQIDEMRQTLDRYPSDVSVPSINTIPLKYGREYWKRIEFARARGNGPAPLVVWVDGADYDSGQPVYSLAWLPSFFHQKGFALARLQSRERTDPKVGERAAHMAAGIAELLRQAQAHHIDPTRIILLGQGSGGHFAALLSTDERYLARAGVPFGSIRAAVIVNGEGFDVPRRIASSSRHVAKRFERAFGMDVERQRHLSPISAVEPPNAPSFLFIAVNGAADLPEQARQLASALSAAGASARLASVPQQTGRTARSYLGAPQNPFTDDLLAFLEQATGRRTSE